MNKLLAASLVLITVLVRFYRLPETFMFAEDQEDLSLRVKQVVIDRQPTLISAKFSTGGAYLPPGYLYFLAPFFVAANWHPMAAMIVVVTLSGLTALLMFLAGGVTAWTLYTFWPTLHTWDRIFWNPNLILPAAALVAFGLRRRQVWLAAAGVAIAWQSHPQALVLTLITLFYFHRHWRLIGGSLLIAFAPLVIFELRHGFVVTKALFNPQSFTFRPYYLLFSYPFIILALSWLFSRSRWLLIFPLIFLIMNLSQIFNQPARPDNLTQKLAATNAAVDQIQAGQASSNIQIQGPAAGFHYLIWYLSRVKGITAPIAFHESWDQPPPDTAVIRL